MSKKNSAKAEPKFTKVVIAVQSCAKTEEGEALGKAVFEDIDSVLTNATATVVARVAPIVQAVVESPDSEGIAYPLVMLANGKYGPGFRQWFRECGFTLEESEGHWTITGFKYPEGVDSPEDIAIMAEGTPLNIIHEKEKGTEKEQPKYKKWCRLDNPVMEDVRKTLKKKIAGEWKKHSTATTVQNFVNDVLLSEDFIRDALAAYLAKDGN